MYAEKFPHPEAADFSLLAREDEKQVLLALVKFQAQFERAVETDEPSTLIACLLNFAGTISFAPCCLPRANGNSQPCCRLGSLRATPTVALVC